MNKLLFCQAMAGGLGGLVGWFLTALVRHLAAGSAFLDDSGRFVVLAVLLSMVTGIAVTVTSRQVRNAEPSLLELIVVCFASIACGGGVGLLVALLFERVPSVASAVAIVSVVVGGLVGGVSGLNVSDLRLRQLLVAGLGGGVGGMVGACVLLVASVALPEGQMEGVHALAWTLSLMFAGAGSALLPAVMAAGTLRFERCGDPKIARKYAGQSWPLPADARRPIALGSSPKLRAPHLSLRDPGISPKHAEIHYDPVIGFSIARHADARPDAVISVNGRPIGAQRVPLRASAVVELGSMQLHFSPASRRHA